MVEGYTCTQAHTLLGLNIDQVSGMPFWEFKLLCVHIFFGLRGAKAEVVVGVALERPRVSQLLISFSTWGGFNRSPTSEALSAWEIQRTDDNICPRWVPLAEASKRSRRLSRRFRRNRVPKSGTKQGSRNMLGWILPSGCVLCSSQLGFQKEYGSFHGIASEEHPVFVNSLLTGGSAQHGPFAIGPCQLFSRWREGLGECEDLDKDLGRESRRLLLLPWRGRKKASSGPQLPTGSLLFSFQVPFTHPFRK